MFSLASAQARLALVLDTVSLRDNARRDTARSLEIAYVTGQKSSYDAMYLALAERVGCDYWTADARFANPAMALFPQIRLIS